MLSGGGPGWALTCGSARPPCRCARPRMAGTGRRSSSSTRCAPESALHKCVRACVRKLLRVWRAQHDVRFPPRSPRARWMGVHCVRASGPLRSFECVLGGRGACGHLRPAIGSYEREPLGREGPSGKPARMWCSRLSMGAASRCTHIAAGDAVHASIPPPGPRPLPLHVAEAPTLHHCARKPCTPTPAAARTHALMHTHAHACTHMHKHAHTRTHAHAHTSA